MFENVGQFEDERDALEQFILHTKQFLLHIAFEHYFEKFTYSDGDAILFEPLHRAQYQRALSEYMGSGELERLIRQVAQVQNDLPQLSSLDLSLVLAGAHGSAVLGASARVDPVTDSRSDWFVRRMPSAPGDTLPA